jgi:Zn-dependent M28 family amino/carboxypeptidase
MFRGAGNAAGGRRPPFTVSDALVDRLRGHADVLAGLIGPRHLGRPTSVEAAAAYIEQQFTAFGDTVERQPYAVGDQTAENLVVERTGRGDPGEIIVLGAHYDTVPETPGADDNASAVALLIEAARLLVPIETRRTLRFVSFACEEPPHFYTDTMGSEQYARRCRVGGEQIVGMICLEMVGYYTSAANSQGVPPAIPRWLRWLFPSRGDFLVAVGNLRSWRLLLSFRRGFRSASALRLFSIALPESVNEIRLSDNSSFWDQGYPALMVTDTSFLRNPHYHRPTDTPDTLDYARLAAATCGVAGALKRLAGAT